MFYLGSPRLFGIQLRGQIGYHPPLDIGIVGKLIVIHRHLRFSVISSANLNKSKVKIPTIFMRLFVHNVSVA